jgi:glycosyltransferase involved in cell wall biosynthesis
MNMLIEGLLERGHQIKVLAVNSFKYNIHIRSIPPEYLQKTGIELIPLDIRVKLFPAFKNIFTGRSYHAERFISAGFSERIRQVLREEDYDIVQLETIYMASYIGTIRENSNARIVLRAHNIEHLIWERIARNSGNPLKRWYLKHLARTLKRFETSVPSLVDGIAAISGKDADFFKSSPATPVVVIPFGIHPPDYHFEVRSVKDPTIFIIGAMNWMPNAEGVRWFLDKVWPDLFHRYPNLRFHIAGREMPAWMKNLDLPNVIVEGEVGDASSFYAANDIMIVPLFSGSGIRIKVIEAMAYGKTVISTEIGAEGIDYTRGENLLSANLPCEFFEMISVCEDHPEILQKTGLQARNLVESRYNRAAIIRSLEAFYQQLTA